MPPPAAGARLRSGIQVSTRILTPPTTVATMSRARRLRTSRALLLPALALACGLPPLPAVAQEQDADAVARELSNPTNPVFSLTSFLDVTKFKGDLPGAEEQTGWTYSFQPPAPFELGGGVNFFVRPLIPFVLTAPKFTGGGFEGSGFNLGNISLDASFGKTSPSGLILLGGTVWTLPTHTDEDLRANFALGPEIAVGVMKPWGIALLLVTQSFDVSGENKTNTLGGQYVFAKGLGGGWQFVSTPPFAYNWTTEDFTFPIGGGPFRTVFMGDIPVKVGGQFWYYLSQPDPLGPSWQLRVQFQPVFTRPW